MIKKFELKIDISDENLSKLKTNFKSPYSIINLLADIMTGKIPMDSNISLKPIK